MLALDTNILIALQKEEKKADGMYRSAVASGKIIGVPTIVRYEARRSLLKPEHSKRLNKLERLLGFTQPLDFDIHSADQAAEIYHYLRPKGQLLDEADLMIAATALRHGATLVTRNTSHFQRVLNLNLLDWR